MSDWRTLSDDYAARADDDVAVVEVGLNDPRISDRTFGYHAQQAVEKLLKAMISARGVEPSRVHDLAQLADAAAELYGLEDDPLHGPDLTDLAVAHRYPGFAPPAGLDRTAVYQQILAVRKMFLDRRSG